MTRLSILGGIGLAVLLSVTGKILLSSLLLLLPGYTAVKFTLAASVGAYLLLLLAKSRLRNGKIVAFCLWCAASAATFVFGASLFMFAILQLTLLWLIRSFCNYTSLVATLLDLALVAVGALAAFWAYITTGSVLLTIWCFFLTQSLFAAIPQRGLSLKRQQISSTPSTTTMQRFQQACRSAETALSQLNKAQV